MRSIGRPGWLALGLICLLLPMAPNDLEISHPAHGFEATFDRAGARIHDRRTDSEPEAIASLRLVGIGRDEFVRDVGMGEVARVGSRVEIRRAGIVEWYEDRPDGLEQGFTIESRPAGDAPLALELDVLPAIARLAGSDVILSTPSGRTLAYQKLQVADATGIRIPAHFELTDPARVRVVIDDDHAIYPIEIDPILSGSNDTTLVSDRASSLFGYTVASAGDVNGDGYDDVIVGAYDYEEDVDVPGSGAAFIFLGSPTGVPGLPPSQAATRLHGAGPYQYFGVSVSGAGDVNGDGYDDVIVGSNYSDGESDEGAAFVFLGSSTGISNGGPDSAQAVLQGGQENSGFGYSVAAAGDVNDDGYSDVIVGAPQYDGDINGDLIPDGGAAFVFLGSATGVDSAEAGDAATRLIATTSQFLFGFSVASAGDVDGDGDSDVIVGARQFSSGQVYEGAAFIYHGSPNGVPDGSTHTAATLLQSDDPDGQLFDVASAGDLNDDGFDDVVVGIPLRASTDEGAAFIYMGSQSGVQSGGPASAIILISDQYFANFATRATAAGDVNGDGYGDLVIGAARYDAGETDEGAVFLYLGGEGGISGGSAANAFRHLEANDPGALLGSTVASAGDVNGDGLSDLIGGAPYYGANDSGAAFIWTGEDTGGDRDGDGLTNEEERLVYHTDLRNPDSDGDSVNDKDEVIEGSNPLDALDPPRVTAPFTASNLTLSSTSIRKRFRVDLANLPTRAVLIIQATADPLHPDAILEVEALDWNLRAGHPGGSGCPRSDSILTPSIPGSGELALALFQCDPYFNAFAGDSVTVRIGVSQFGSAGGPVSVAVSIRGVTQPPTGSLAPVVIHQLTPQNVRFDAFKDTVLYESFPDRSNGRGSFLWAVTPSTGGPGRRHSLLAFDLNSRIPPGSTVHHAELGLGVETILGSSNTLRIHRMQSSPSGSWNEGDASPSGNEFEGAVASNPAANWLNRSSSGVSWSSPGGDLVSPPVLEQEMFVGNQLLSSPELAVAVAEMIAEERTEDGFGLTSAPDPSGDTGIQLASREGYAANQTSPYLDVSYTPSQPMLSGTVPTGVVPFINEGQNFRWIYDLDHDDVFVTDIGGVCEVANSSLPNNLPYTYRFQGEIGYTGVDCCTWRIESQTGVVGTGQVLFYHNLNPGNPAHIPPDTDQDGIRDLCDNCPNKPNGPLLGTCMIGTLGVACRSNQECGVGGRCHLSQEDSNLDFAGDACPEPGFAAGLAGGLAALTALTRARRRRTTQSGRGPLRRPVDDGWDVSSGIPVRPASE